MAGLARLAVIVVELRRLEATVGRVGQHPPALAEPVVVLLQQCVTAFVGVGGHFHEIAQLVAELHQHAVLLPGQAAAAVLLATGLLAPFDHGAQAQEHAVIGHRQALLAQVGQGRVLQVHGAVGDVQQGHALGVGSLGEIHHARNGLGLLLGHPLVPAQLVVFLAVAHQARLVGRVVQHGLVHVQYHGRLQALGLVAAFFRHQCVPVGFLQRDIQVVGGGTVGLLGDGLVLLRALHPQHCVEIVVGGRIKRAISLGSGGRGLRSNGFGSRRIHALAGGKAQRRSGEQGQGQGNGTTHGFTGNQIYRRILPAKAAPGRLCLAVDPLPFRRPP